MSATTRTIVFFLGCSLISIPVSCMGLESPDLTYTVGNETNWKLTLKIYFLETHSKTLLENRTFKPQTQYSLCDVGRNVGILIEFCHIRSYFNNHMPIGEVTLHSGHVTKESCNGACLYLMTTKPNQAHVSTITICSDGTRLRRHKDSAQKKRPHDPNGATFPPEKRARIDVDDSMDDSDSE